MTDTTQPIGLVIRDDSTDILNYARLLLGWGAGAGYQIACGEQTARMLGLKDPGVPVDELIKLADPIVTLGGDGTLIGVARFASGPCPTLLGVNFGRLGFLTEIHPEELISALEGVLAGTARTKERHMMRCQVIRDGEAIFESQAVNDVVVQKGSRDRLLDLDVFIADEPLMRLRADGLIAATPTGSTAYSLAAGGSIVYPSLGVMLLTPICPHSLSYRPIILPIDYQLNVIVPEYDGEVFVSIDGQSSKELKVGDMVSVTKAKNNVRFVRSPSHSYYDILRNKLNWGHGKELQLKDKTSS